MICVLRCELQRVILLRKILEARFVLLLQNKKASAKQMLFCFGDPYGNRTHVTAVKGPCLNRLTNGPVMVAEVGLEPTTYRV